MSDNSVENIDQSSMDSDSKEGRKKQKIRVKYRQRIKIKERPKGYKFQRFWKKKRNVVVAYIIIAGLLGATALLIVQIGKQQLEQKHQQKRERKMRKKELEGYESGHETKATETIFLHTT